MVLAIGILVDDAIVVVENVERVMEEEPHLSPADAAKKAMTEITAPIIAITLVLLSVFVPIAFIPGISGQLFRQFAVTISVSMLISALNALTLSPALCAVFLRHGGPKRGPMGWVLRRIDNIRDGYAAIVRRLVGVSVFAVVLILASAAGIFGLSLRTPTGFLPEEDQGAFFISVQLPDGASVARTSDAVRRIETLLKQMPQIQNVFAVIGYSILDSVNEPNAAFIVPTLKPFGDRAGAANSAQSLIARVFAEGQQIRTATIIPFNLPPIIGLSTTGGFEYELEGLEGQDPAAMNSVMQGLLAAANQDPRLTRVFSTYTASNPSIYLDIDRQKAQALGLGMNDVFGALQATLGGIYINNFNLFGRVWQVNIQGEAADRKDVSSLWQIYIRNKYGADVPMRSIANARVIVGPQVITRYNNYRAIPIQGGPSPGTSSGTALAAMAEVSEKTLPSGYSYEWTGTAYQEVAASGQTGAILGLAVLFAFLFLVGLYESWMIPVPVLLSVPVGVLGAFVGILLWASVARPLCPDRARGADRDGRQERHSDRRICQGPARAGQGHSGSRGARRADAVSRGHDDLLRLHSRRLPAGGRAGGRRDQPARRRYAGLRRDDCRQRHRAFRDPDALCDIPEPSRAHRRPLPPRKAAPQRD